MADTKREYSRLLAKIGIEKKAAAIYVALLSGGPETVAGLSRKTGFYRPLLYRSIPKLLGKGLLVELRRGKRTLYAAESPEILGEMIREAEKDINEKLGELTALWGASRDKTSVTTFSGKEGIGHAFEVLMMTAKRGDVIYRYESPRDRIRNKKYYPRLYVEKACGTAASVDKYVITNEKTHLARRASINRYSKPIPEKYDPFNYDVTLLVLNDKVAFIDFDTEQATIIESPRLAQFQTKLFKLLFKTL